MKVPNLLYHGTSMIRYQRGIRKNGINGKFTRWPELKGDDERGWVHLTDNQRQAAAFAIIAGVEDKVGLPQLRQMQGNPAMQDYFSRGVVFTVATSAISESIAYNPAGEAWYKSLLEFTNNNPQELEALDIYGKWWKTKFVSPQKIIQPTEVMPAPPDEDARKFYTIVRKYAEKMVAKRKGQYGLIKSTLSKNRDLLHSTGVRPRRV